MSSQKESKVQRLILSLQYSVNGSLYSSPINSRIGRNLGSTRQICDSMQHNGWFFLSLRATHVHGTLVAKGQDEFDQVLFLAQIDGRKSTIQYKTGQVFRQFHRHGTIQYQGCCGTAFDIAFQDETHFLPRFLKWYCEYEKNVASLSVRIKTHCTTYLILYI